MTTAPTMKKHVAEPIPLRSIQLKMAFIFIIREEGKSDVNIHG